MIKRERERERESARACASAFLSAGNPFALQGWRVCVCGVFHLCTCARARVRVCVRTHVCVCAVYVKCIERINKTAKTASAVRSIHNTYNNATDVAWGELCLYKVKTAAKPTPD